MSKGLKIFLTVIAIMLATIIIGFLIILTVVDHNLPNGDAARKQVQTSYNKIKLPEQFKYVDKEETGDPLDSPDSFGWIYNYAYELSFDKETAADTLKQSLVKSGYKITSETAGKNEPVLIEASKSVENVGLHARLGNAKATIVAEVIQYKGKNE